MSLRDDILDERAKGASALPPAYSDEEVYQRIISCVHRSVVCLIKEYFREHPTSRTWRMKWDMTKFGAVIPCEELPKYRKECRLSRAGGRTGFRKLCG